MTSRPKALDAWSGEFGDRYTQRNAATGDAVRGRVRVWSQIFQRMQLDLPKSILEVGPNLGLNLRALPAVAELDLWAIEPNASARDRLVADKVIAPDHLMAGFGHEIPLADGAVDMAFTSGVLIHVDPSLLEQTMREIHRVSNKYVYCAEYFAPGPESVPYRGESDLLFRNDFGSLYLDLFPDLVLVDHGFFWKRTTVMDDSTWWLFRKA